MSWGKFHRKSEEYADAADVARWQGNLVAARHNYLLAAEWEQRALAEVGRDDPRTFGITAVSAAALYYKGKDFEAAQTIVRDIGRTGFISARTRSQLDEIEYYSECEKEQAKIDSFSWILSHNATVDCRTVIETMVSMAGKIDDTARRMHFNRDKMARGLAS